MPGDLLVRLEAVDELVDHPTRAADVASTGPAAVAGAVRPDLAESIERHRIGLDEARPDAVARRRARHRRTARENVADLVDAGLVRRVRAGRHRRPSAAAGSCTTSSPTRPPTG